MRRLALLLAALLIAGGSSVAAQDPSDAPDAPLPELADLPDVVARVHGVEIHRDELLAEVQGAYQQLRQLGARPTVDRTFLGKALDQLIAGLLIHEQAAREGVAATAAEVDESWSRVRSSFTSEEAFQDYLTREATTVDGLREDLAREISRRKFLEHTLASKVVVTEDEMRAYYDENLERMQRPERVKLRHILIALPEKATPEETAAARTRAEGLLARVRAGEDFAALAYESSEDESRARGGEIPWITRGQTVPAFEQAAFDLGPGEVSEVVESPLGFHIIKVLDHEQARVTPFEEVKERIGVVLGRQRAETLLRERVDELMAATEIERFLP